MVPPSLDISAGGGGKRAFWDPTFLPFCAGNFSTRLEVADRPNIFARPALEFGSITAGASSGFRERESAFVFSLPGLCMNSYEYSLSLVLHRIRRCNGGLTESIHFRDS